jgi:hypothetical protein
MAKGTNNLKGPGPGRPKGMLNANTKALKDMILGALDQAGGQDYLARQAEENPGPFLALVGKCLPKDINANVSAGVTIVASSLDEKL